MLVDQCLHYTNTRKYLEIQVVAEFFPLFEDLCISDHCGIMLKRPDKKKERSVHFIHCLCINIMP